MMHTYIIEVNTSKRNAELCEYFADTTTDFRCMRNTANFYIRNTMTGIQKQEEERTDLEKEVLRDVFDTIKAVNEAAASEGKKPKFKYPTKEKWFLGYDLLEAIFRHTENQVYNKMHSQVRQKAIKKTVESWKAYFHALKAYKKNPGSFTGKPKIPKYIRDEKATAAWSNQAAKLKFIDGKAYLRFACCNKMLYIGKESKFAGEKYIKTEVRPAYGIYYVMVVFENQVTEPELPLNPKRMLGVDLGLDNFAAVAGNFGVVPFLIKGGPIKAINQWFNKERARLMSELTRGQDPKESRKQSRRLKAISRKRSDAMRDFFYKCAWHICRYAVLYDVKVIVVGHNTGQKQEIDMGKKNNQNFVSIPYSSFLWILRNVAALCEICVVTREESYTSKASLLDMDEIPVYQKGDATVHTFSGKRVQRGLYQSADGRVINADVNGAGNILRKEYPHAFDGLTLFYLYKTTQVVRYWDLYQAPPEKRNPNVFSKKRPKRGSGSKVNHAYRKEKRRFYTDVFWEAKPQQQAK